MPLSPSNTRKFVVAFMALLFGLAILATVLIVNGWNDDGLQQEVRRMEDARR